MFWWLPRRDSTKVCSTSLNCSIECVLSHIRDNPAYFLPFVRDIDGVVERENGREEREGGKEGREREEDGQRRLVGGLWKGKGSATPSDSFISFETEAPIIIATMNNTYISY